MYSTESERNKQLDAGSKMAILPRNRSSFDIVSKDRLRRMVKSKPQLLERRGDSGALHNPPNIETVMQYQ